MTTRRVLLIVGALIALIVFVLVFISLSGDDGEVESDDEFEQELVCGEVDVDLDRDRRHCGQCDRRCEDDEVCRDGECGQALAWTDLSASGAGVCGLRRDDSLWCWGDDVEAPRQIGESSWSSISVGHLERCGIQDDQSLWCWGSGEEPTKVDDEQWTSVSSGLRHSCGIRDDDSLWCWGKNDRGQLGDGTTEDRAGPVEVSEHSSWEEVAAGSYYTCGLGTDGSLWCWGSSDSHHPTESAKTPELMGTSMDWTSLTAGAFDTCLLREDHSRWCWGQDQYRTSIELGVRADDPQQIDEDWQHISLGAGYFCGIRQDQSLWCSEGRLRLVQVGEKEDWEAIASGRNQACGIRQGGTLWCWEAQEEARLIEDFDGELAEQIDQDELQFFLAGDDLRWYEVDSQGLTLRHRIETPGPVVDMQWVDHRGLAVMTYEVRESPSKPNIEGALIAEDCSDAARDDEDHCQYSIRRLLLLEEEDFESGEFTSLTLPEEQDWHIDRNLTSMAGDVPSIVSDFHIPRTGQGDLWVHRCRIIDYTDYCMAESKIRILPDLQRGTDVEARPAQPLQLQDSPPPPGYLARALRGGAGEVNFLCLSPDGSYSESERRFPDTGMDRIHWVAHQPPTFIARVATVGNEYTEISYHAHRACDGEPFAEIAEFRRGPSQSAFVKVDEGWQVYFQMQEKGHAEGGSQLVFRPQHAPPREPAPEGEPEEPADLSQYRPRSMAQWALMGFPNRHQCDTYDYFPNGGIYSVYCRLNFRHSPVELSLGALEKALGMPVFLDGPHQDGELNVRAARDFGRYNPEFVKSLSDWLVPVLKQQTSKYIYETYLQRLARTYWLVYQRLQRDQEFWDRETRAFKAYLEVDELGDHDWRPGKYLSLEISSGYDFNDDLNIRYHAVRYWLRRTLDGTHALFAEHLKTMLETFDQAFLAAHPEE